MNVSEAVTSRHSVRAFLDTQVDRPTLETLLERARWAPSGGNLQPWKVFVLGGERMTEFRSLMHQRLAALPSGEPPEYLVYPPSLHEPYRSRRFKCGEDLYASIDVPRSDKPARLRQFANNFDFFGAPVALFFAIDRAMQEGQWADLGMFMQTFMLLSREAGLHTCAQEAWSQWPETLGSFLNMPPELKLFSGMALGYKDESQPINSWRTERAPLDEWAEWHGL